MNDSFAIPVMKLMRKFDVRSRKVIFSPANPDVMPEKIRFSTANNPLITWNVGGSGWDLRVEEVAIDHC